MNSLQQLLAALWAHDPQTARHSYRVQNTAAAWAQTAGLDEQQRNTLTTAALYHDIGKLLVPKEILTKPGTLTKEEFTVIRQHPIWSYELIQPHVPEEVALIVRYHHESYPERTHEVPPLTAILSAIDKHDAASTRTRRPWDRSAYKLPTRAHLSNL